MGPKRLWTGDWSAQSAASRARMAERRGLVAPEPEPVPEPLTAPEPFAEPAPSQSIAQQLRAAFARLAASTRAFAAELRHPGDLRVRLAFIALIAAAAGAGTVIGIDAASPSSGPSAPAGANHAYLGVVLGSAIGQVGAMVEFVYPGTPAEDGGILPGDVITAIDGREIDSPQAASAVIGSLPPNASAQFALERFGQPVSVHVTLGSRASAAP
jgi:membrane-associated protease RseP (regulator of RpoE activity)